MSTLCMRLLGVACLMALGAESLRGETAAGPLPPWTPVTAAATAKDSVEIGVWGRKCAFEKSALPTRMSTAGVELLAAPMRLAATVAGNEKELEWPRSGALLFSRTDAQAVVSGWQAGDALIANTTVRVDYDGMLRVDLVVNPQRGAKGKLERLWLEIPLQTPRATLFHLWPGGWGKAENSNALPASGLTLPFKPLVWLGWEDGGLAWFAESDRRWQPKDAARAIEVVRGDRETVLRLRLLDSPPERLPVTFTFGLQATPVKPIPRDFHEWRIWHAPQLATTMGKSASVVFREWKTCHRAFPDGNPLPALDRAAKLGVKTVVFHEDWTPIQNYPATTEEPELRRVIDACHARGMKVLLYFGYELSSLAPEWADVSDEVLVKNAQGAVTPGWHRLPEQRDFKVCYGSRWQETLVAGIGRLMDRCKFDGVYLDGTVEPWGCCNQAHGCGYQTAEGKLKPTYPIFAVRRLMQRLYTMIHPRGGLVNAHQSTCCLPPTLAFADSYWDGEQFAGGELSANLLERLPLACFRAEFMGKNFGVPCEFLAYERPPNWTIEHALAFTMLHDVRVRPHGSGPLLERMAGIWDAMTRFGVSEAQWHPYWKNERLISTQPAMIKASLYFHPASGAQPARALLVASNLSSQEAMTAQLQLAGELSSAVKAADALSGERLELVRGRIAVPLQPMRMRMVSVE